MSPLGKVYRVKLMMEMNMMNEEIGDLMGLVLVCRDGYVPWNVNLCLNCGV